jgi:hypothetical protein
MSSKKNRTASAIFNKGFKEPYLRANEAPFIKLLNWYTGFGKTHTAASFSIDLFINCDVIPVFIAPLQSLVAQFSEEVGRHQKSREYADEIQAAIQARGVAVPVHRLYSIEYHLNDRTFFQATLAFVDWLEANPALCSRMEQTTKHADSDKGMRAKLMELKSKSNACVMSNFLAMSPSDDTYADTQMAYIKSARRARGLAESLTWRLIRMDVESRPRERDEERYLRVPQVAELVRRLHPLQAFLDNPGIIVSTASKAQVAHKVYAADEKGGFKAHEFDNLPLFLEELNRDGSRLGRLVSRRPDSARVVTFVDEEEDSYWYLFDARKSVVNSGGRNDLNIVISEFFQYFDLKWPMAFERLERDGPRLGLATKVYDHLEHFAKVSKVVEDEFKLEATRTGAKYIADARRVAILREALVSAFPKTAERFTEEELLVVLNQLHDRNDAHAGFKRFRQKARVLERIRAYVLEIKQPDLTAYETFRNLHDLVANKKFFTMSRSTYGEVMDQPGQTFFSESASVMDTEFLRQVQLSRDTAHQTVRLDYHDGELPSDAYTLLDYLKLVVFMAKVLAQQTGDDAIEMATQDVERYTSLNRFRTDVRRLFKDPVTSEGLQNDSSDTELLTDSFLFEHTKSVVTLEESRVQAEEYNIEADVSLTLTITSLRATPEEDIVRALGRTNGVYLMSATGGLDSASSGAFNTKHLRRCLEARGGHFAEMSEDELAVVSAEAVKSLGMRERKVTILDDSDPSRTFGVSKAYRGLVDMFKDAIPKRDEAGYTQLNRHKKNELEGLVASLDRLLSTPVRSGLVLCQTVSNMRRCLMRLANARTGVVTQKDTTGDHFVIRQRALPTYRSMAGGDEEVTLILYTAGRFRSRDNTKTGALQENDDPGQFSKELMDALDITRGKVLLWTAYASASRGINFITKQNGEERDFELFCLLNDPYYTRHTRPGATGFSMEMFQSFAQVLRDENSDFAAMSKGDLLFQYSRHRWKRLRKEHVIDITRTVFQALGRGERRPNEQMTQQLFLSSEAARMVHLGLRHAPELRKRASPAQRAVLQQLEVHNVETSIFPTQADREVHQRESLKKALRFRRFTSETPKRFRSDAAARTSWDKLFDATMFKDPLKYLAGLEAAGIPADYRDGCFVEVPVTAEAYTREISVAGTTETVITDAMDGTEIYSWIGGVASDALVPHLSPQTQSLLKEWRGFQLPDKAQKLLPQPWFIAEIMKGYIAELEFEQYVGTQFNVWPKDLPLGGGAVEYLHPATHPLYADLYQLFDYYIVPQPGVLVAVDMKNWARSTDGFKKQQLQEEAQAKHERLRKLLPDSQVHALYVNLHGAHKFAVARPPAGSIRFMSLFVPSTGSTLWMANANLREALLGK